jgi:cyclic lactone autoinducer peptide
MSHLSYTKSITDFERRVFMGMYLTSVRKASLRLLGVTFAFVGGLIATQLKVLWFYQPEVPDQLK